MLVNFSSRTGAIVAAAAFCKYAEGPSVLPTLDSLKDGMMGLVFVAKGQTVQQLYYPLGVADDVETPLTVVGARAADRMGVVVFCDDHPTALVYDDPLEKGCFVVDCITGTPECLFIPHSLYSVSASLVCLLNKLRANSSVIESAVINEIAELTYGLPPREAEPASMAKSTYPPIPFKFMVPAIELVVKDRVDAVKLFDDLFFGDDAIIAVVHDTLEYCLISTERAAYAFVSIELVKQFFSIFEIVEFKAAAASGYVVDRSDFLAKP